MEVTVDAADLTQLPQIHGPDKRYVLAKIGMSENYGQFGERRKVVEKKLRPDNCNSFTISHDQSVDGLERKVRTILGWTVDAEDILSLGITKEGKTEWAVFPVDLIAELDVCTQKVGGVQVDNVVMYSRVHHRLVEKWNGNEVWNGIHNKVDINVKLVRGDKEVNVLLKGLTSQEETEQKKQGQKRKQTDKQTANNNGKKAKK